MREPTQLGQPGRAGAAGAGEQLFRCPVCDSYLKKSEGFTCPMCRRGPLCKSHRVRGKKECTSCVFELQMKELRDLKGQEQSIRSFLRLLQFLFIVFAMVFIALKTDIVETIEFLKYGIITDSLTLLGGVSVAGYVLFYIIMYNQRQKIRELESGVNRSEFRRIIK